MKNQVISIVSKGLLAFIIGLSLPVLAESKCGKVTGVVFNHHDHPVQGISGFWVKQSTRDIRVTRGMNEDLMLEIESLDSILGLFICLDDFQLVPKPYAGRTRIYAEVLSYRLWQNGQRIK